MSGGLNMPDARSDTLVRSAMSAMSSTWAGLETFGPYRLAGLIARGGMAELYLAIRDHSSVRQVLALKRILPGAGDPELFHRMFVQEAALTARLEHPNIVRVVDFGEVEGQVYLAMEYLPGEDLERILQRYGGAGTRMPLRMAAELVRGMAAGLGHAHGLSDDDGHPLHLVHRDVTPSNVVVTYQGFTKLVDFGIAKARNGSLKTSVGTIKGKLAYLPPEAFTRSSVDARGDVYSAGCVLWEMMVGTRPFDAPNDAALMSSIVHGSLPDVREVAPDVDDTLAGLCMRALAKEPEDRFPSASHLEEALDDYLDATGGHLAPRQIAQWMTGLFGPEVAQAKLDAASGSRLSTALPLILATVPGSASASMVSQRSGRVTPGAPPSASVRSVPPPIVAAPPERPLRPWVPLGVVVASAMGVVALTGAGLWVMSAEGAAPPAVEEPTVTMEVTSTPEGAAVFVDGEPLGRLTPTRLGSLRPGTALLLGVQLAGYEGDERRVVPGQGPTEESFSLVPRRRRP